MRQVRLASEIDFDGWRSGARKLINQHVPPQDVEWTIGEAPSMLAAEGADPAAEAAPRQFTVPRSFMKLAESVVLHSDPDRFALLYRLLWRLQDEPHLMTVASDADIARARAMSQAVGREIHETHGLAGVRAAARHCTACPLYAAATQTVFGEGPQETALMFVGEQPGDQEDLAGRPFVGPAGQLFDRALAEAGIRRPEVYITNAVKHFKFELRGKRRLHKTPGQLEIEACRQWLEREIALIRPRLIVTLGATAAHAVLGKPTPIQRNRGKTIRVSEETQVLITVHPSYLLRVPEENQPEEYRKFVADLALVRESVAARTPVTSS